MSYWLAHTLKSARERAGHKPSAVASAANLNPATIYRLEKGHGWSRDTDRLVAAYAQVIGWDDARELWDIALKMWMRHGQPPQLEEPPALQTTAAEIERELDAALRERQQSSPATGAGGRARRKTRAAG